MGPTSCRKTTFLQRLQLENVDLFESRPHRVRYCYGSSQDTFDNMQRYGVEFHKGVPSHDNIKKWFGDILRGILVLDDLMSEGGDDKEILNLFTQCSHHMNVMVCYLCQDLFPKGKFAKAITLVKIKSMLSVNSALHFTKQVVAGIRVGKPLQVEIYSKDGEFVYCAEIAIDGEILPMEGMTMTTKGRIACVVDGKVFIF